MLASLSILLFSYSTYGVGKWHLGFYAHDVLPTSRGFDHFYGVWTGSIDHWNHTQHEPSLFGLETGDSPDLRDMHDDEEIVCKKKKHIPQILC